MNMPNYVTHKFTHNFMQILAKNLTQESCVFYFFIAKTGFF
jgi:hypothetical protein